LTVWSIGPGHWALRSTIGHAAKLTAREANRDSSNFTLDTLSERLEGGQSPQGLPQPRGKTESLPAAAQRKCRSADQHGTGSIQRFKDEA